MSFKIIGIGEVLWDLLPSGPQLGGAPANFTFHAHALGARAGVVTRIGNDALGTEILQRLEQAGVESGAVQVDEEAPTGTVTVELSAEGVPNFTIHENVAWDRLEVTPRALDEIRAADAICFGSLAQRSESARIAVQKLVASAPAEALRIFDINLRQHYYSQEVIESSLRLAHVLKLNDVELPILAGMFNLAGTTREQIKRLSDQFDLQVIALTRGGEGSMLYQQGEWSDQPSEPVEIADTVGAGDAFTAALVLGLLHRLELGKINTLAGEVARYVCSCAGATPPLPKHFRDRLKH